MAPRTAKPAAPTVVPQSTKKADPVVPVKTDKKAKVSVPVVPAVSSTDKVASTEEVAPVATSALDDVETKLASLISVAKELQGTVKVLKREYDRLKKAVEKTERKRANARTNPNGFAKPAKIVPDLCDFVGVPHGSEMSRTDVTRKITAYIRDHQLNKPENKRFILPDPKLRKILNVKEGEEVSYFSLQKLLSPLFIKTVPVVAPVAPVAPA